MNLVFMLRDHCLLPIILASHLWSNFSPPIARVFQDKNQWPSKSFQTHIPFDTVSNFIALPVEHTKQWPLTVHIEGTNCWYPLHAYRFRRSIKKTVHQIQSFKHTYFLPFASICSAGPKYRIKLKAASPTKGPSTFSYLWNLQETSHKVFPCQPPFTDVLQSLFVFLLPPEPYKVQSHPHAVSSRT